MFYLQRFATSKNHLRHVMMRRAEPEADHHGIDKSTLENWVDAILDDFERVGLIDDRIYAQQLFDRLSKRGQSPRQLRLALRRKGLDRNLIDPLFENESDELEIRAALRLAQRKRLGPWRSGDAGPDTERRELAKFARAGFGYEVAARVVRKNPKDLDL